MGELQKGEKHPSVIGIGEWESEGIRHGYVVNPTLASESIRTAVSMAEKSAGIRIRKAAIALGGTTLSGETLSGEAIISKADGEVTPLDIEKALEDCESKVQSNNKKIIRIVPLSYKLDGKEILGRPEGLKGTKLEVKALFVTCLNQHVEDLIEAVTLAGIEPTDIVPSIFSASNIALSAKQKVVGAALVNIGSETVSVGVFENESIISLHTFSIGSSDITNDIALGMKVSLEKAEDLKLGNIDPVFPKKKLDEIVDARLSDIFELIENHLKKIKRNGLLPAGIVFIGGGANVANLEELSKEALRLPSAVGSTDMFSNSVKTKLRDPSWFAVLGLLNPSNDDYEYSSSSSSGLWKNLKNIVKSSIKQLLP